MIPLIFKRFFVGLFLVSFCWFVPVASVVALHEDATPALWKIKCTKDTVCTDGNITKCVTAKGTACATQESADNTQCATGDPCIEEQATVYTLKTNCTRDKPCNVSPSCVARLKEKYFVGTGTQETSDDEDTDTEEDEDTDTQKKHLSFKEECKKEKTKIEACCTNPNACDGIVRDIVRNVGPLIPSLYGTFKALDMDIDGLSHAEVANEMCDTQNEVAMLGFTSALLQQLSPVFRNTCDKEIKKCRKKCNEHISDFKQEFSRCFSAIIPELQSNNMLKIFVSLATSLMQKPNSTMEELIEYVKMCGDDPGTSTNTTTTIAGTDCNVYSTQKTNRPYIIIPLDEDRKITSYIAKEDIESMQEFYQAFKKSGIKELQLKTANEAKVVNCAKIKNHKSTPSYQPGGPISPPMVNLCRQAVESILEEPPPPTPPPPPLVNTPPPSGTTSTALTGLTGKPGFDFMSDPDGTYGIQPDDTTDDEDFQFNNKPALVKNPPGWVSSGGPGGSPGGGASGGGLSGGGGGDDESTDSGDDGYIPRLLSNSGFNGGGGTPGGGYQSHRGGGNQPSSPYRQAAAAPSVNNNKGEDANHESDLDEEDPGESIFQIASQRIQLFCADHSCGK